jgi:hypothetical protein
MEAGADGVIIGSRLVRAVGEVEPADAAARARVLVEGFSAALLVPSVDTAAFEHSLKSPGGALG